MPFRNTPAFVLAALLAVAAPIRAAEIDSVTDRGIRLEDASKPLERWLNDAIESGVSRANQAGESCDEEALYDGLRGALARPFIGHVIAERLNDDESLDRRRVSRSDSIYRDLGLFDNVSVHVKDLSAVVRVDDALVGVDKFGHWTVEGWAYFERAELDGDGIEAAMDWGAGTEDTYFGHYTTGVHSYADLVANFEGMRFWQRVLASADDPIDGGWRSERPYVQCKRRHWFSGERQWKRTRKIRLRDYVTPAWDEAVNCSSFRNPEIERRVTLRIAERGEADGVDYTCPIEPAACARARKRYGAWAPQLLHPACLAATEPRRSRWVPRWGRP